MRIKELSITRYGPLASTGRVNLEGFNLFFGRNEDGKTLTIDAIVKLLLGSDSKVFEKINRVDENPEGYVVLSDEGGNEIKLPEKGLFTNMVDLTPRECRNIFVIRNSDLSLDSESDFYNKVSERLSGLRTSQISAIEDSIIEVAKLTPSGDIRNIRGEKLKDRVDGAKNLLGQIEDLYQRMEEANLGEIEQEYSECKEKIGRVVERIDLLDQARKREKYKKGKQALSDLRNALEDLDKLQGYNEQDQQTWRDAENDIARHEQRKQELESDLRSKEKRLEELTEQLNQKEAEFRVSQQTKQRLDNEIKPQIREYENSHLRLIRQKMKYTFVFWSATASGILLGISLVAAAFRPSPWFFVFSVIFAAAFAGCGAVIYWHYKNVGSVSEKFEAIALNLSRYDLRAENVNQIMQNIQQFDDEHAAKQDYINQLKIQKENIKSQIDNLRDRDLPQIEDQILGAKSKIDQIKIDSGEANLGQYTQRLKQRQNLENLTGSYQSVLASHFGSKSDDLQENLDHWDKEIDTLEIYANKAEAIRYSEEQQTNQQSEKDSLEEKLDDIQQTIGSFQKELQQIEQRANGVLALERDYLKCQTSVDLKAVRERLQGFVAELMDTKNSALNTIEIFKEMEAEEREKVSQLFGSQSPVSKYIHQITNGLYLQALFKADTGEIAVERKDSVLLGAEKLSGSAYDQLYFSIRLALGEKLLEDKKGFFIMDDPFVKADSDRLLRQLDVLRKIAELGWQIMYFSAKGEIKDALEADINRGAVNYVEVRSTF